MIDVIGRSEEINEIGLGLEVRHHVLRPREAHPRPSITGANSPHGLGPCGAPRRFSAAHHRTLANALATRLLNWVTLTGGKFAESNHMMTLPWRMTWTSIAAGTPSIEIVTWNAWLSVPWRCVVIGLTVPETLKALMDPLRCLQLASVVTDFATHSRRS
jgi:hypothetical protein